MSEQRLKELKTWLSDKYSDLNLKALNNDASFRKYYRFQPNAANSSTLIAMDSPPDKENNNAFINIQKIFAEHAVTVPRVINANYEQGFFVIEDLGDGLILSKLKTTNNPDSIYGLCIDELIKIQSCARGIEQKYNYNIPYFDNKLLSNEMELFRDWFLAQYLKFTISDNDNSLLDKVFAKLLINANDQPQVLVHRDFHSRNLLLTSRNKIGVIDFQDAVWGPLTYDIVSLYRDCYISWPIEKVKDWCYSYYARAVEAKIIDIDVSFDDYWHWFLLMTLQRNFKTIGIFARLFIRDGKAGYLQDIPRTLNYAIDISAILARNSDYNKYKLFSDLNGFLIRTVLPLLQTKKEEVL